MKMSRLLPFVCLLVGLSLSAVAQEPSSEPPEAQANARPAELEALQAWVGVWDAEIEVWPQGPDAQSIKFKGVETNRPYGEHWLASDFDSDFQGQTIKVHSIVGYDLDKQKMAGMVIDQAPYAATMTGDYDPQTKTVRWTTRAKSPSGEPMLQKTTVTQKSADERLLVLSVPAAEEGEFTKFMQIRFTKRGAETAGDGTAK